MGYTINADTGQLVPRCDDYLGRRLNRATPSGYFVRRKQLKSALRYPLVILSPCYLGGHGRHRSRAKVLTDCTATPT